MFYVNFEDHITARFGVVLENWPLKKFAVPGSLSRIELEVLLNAWQNGMTRFRDLTDDEWEEWMEAYRAGRATALVTSQYALGMHIGAAPLPTTESVPDLEVRITPESMPAPVPMLVPVPESMPALPMSHATPEQPMSTPASDLTPTLVNPPAPTIGQKHTFNFINAVTNVDGTGLVVPKRTCKARTQKTTATGDSSSSTSVPAKPKPKPCRKKASAENTPPT